MRAPTARASMCLAVLSTTATAFTPRVLNKTSRMEAEASSYTLLGDGDCRCAGDGAADRYYSSHWSSSLGYGLAECQNVCSSYSWCQALQFGHGTGGCIIYAAPHTDSIRPASITNFNSGQAFRDLNCEVTEVNHVQGQCYLKEAPTPAPSPAPGAAAAVGDPHLQNVHGQRFDLMMPGNHVLLNVPRELSAENALLRVAALASRLGGHCEDIYFTELNITGSWAYAQQVGGYRFGAQQGPSGSGKWFAVGKVGLKVVHGHTESGGQYLNLLVKHLGRTGFPVGGLLGDDDHSGVSELPASCVGRLSLQKLRAHARSSGSHATASAVATFM